MTIAKTIRPYRAPAGGWGALKATGEALLEQRTPIKGSATLLRINQPTGFDCPGCAWPDPKHTSSFEFCENGAKAVAWEATSKRCTPDFFAAHTVTELAALSDFDLEMEGRLTHPMRYDASSDRYRPVAWDEAFGVIADRLNSLASPNEAAFYTSGRSSNEAAFLYQLFVREFGTNNFPDCSNMCHEPTSVGLPASIGVGKGTCLLDDFDLADAIFIFGQNPGTNSPRMLTSLRNASKRGATIISFNPFRERALERFQSPQDPIEMLTLGSTPISKALYQVRVGGDVAVLKGMMKALLAADDTARQAGRAAVLDWPFIEGHTHGFEAFASDIRATDWSDIEARSGLSRAEIQSAAAAYARAERAILVYGMGITQHRNGAHNVQQIANLALMRGNIGRPGAGICPVRGHSNVQGDRTVGITEIPTAEFLGRLESRYGFTPPSEPGHNVVSALDAMLRGDLKVFVGLGGNFAGAVPDHGRTHDAIRSLDLTVQVSTKLNRGHLVHGREALILPCLGRTEIDRQATGPQSVTVEDSMSMVHASAGRNHPASDALRSEPAIVAGIAVATLGARSRVAWERLVGDYDLIRDEIAAIFPAFQGYNERVRVPGGFHLANTARERTWATPTGRANFLVTPGLAEDLPLGAPDALWLTSMRSHDQYNTTLYSNSDRYRGVYGQRDVVFLNDEEMARRGFKAGDRVDLVTLSSDDVERRVRRFQVVPYSLPSGCCGGYYPEVNPLVPLYDRDPVSGTPSYKAVPVRLVLSMPG